MRIPTGRASGRSHLERAGRRWRGSRGRARSRRRTIPTRRPTRRTRPACRWRRASRRTARARACGPCRRRPRAWRSRRRRRRRGTDARPAGSTRRPRTRAAARACRGRSPATSSTLSTTAAGLGHGVGPHARLGVVAAHPERHDAQRGQLGIPVEHAGQRVLEHVAVVDARAHDDLAVHLDAVVEQGPQPAEAGGPAAVAQHLGADVGIGGVDRHVERAQPLGDDALEVGLGEPGEGGEVPVEEAQPVVVVLEVEALPQARRQLVDEAELAVVVAGAHLVEQRRLHLHAERLTGPLVDLHRRARGRRDRGRAPGSASSTRNRHSMMSRGTCPSMAWTSSPTSTPARAAGEPGATATTRGAGIGQGYGAGGRTPMAEPGRAQPPDQRADRLR